MEEKVFRKEKLLKISFFFNFCFAWEKEQSELLRETWNMKEIARNKRISILKLFEMITSHKTGMN